MTNHGERMGHEYGSTKYRQKRRGGGGGKAQKLKRSWWERGGKTIEHPGRRKVLPAPAAVWPPADAAAA